MILTDDVMDAARKVAGKWSSRSYEFEDFYHDLLLRYLQRPCRRPQDAKLLSVHLRGLRVECMRLHYGRTDPDDASGPTRRNLRARTVPILSGKEKGYVGSFSIQAPQNDPDAWLDLCDADFMDGIERQIEHGVVGKVERAPHAHTLKVVLRRGWVWKLLKSGKDTLAGIVDGLRAYGYSVKSNQTVSQDLAALGFKGIGDARGHFV